MDKLSERISKFLRCLQQLSYKEIIGLQQDLRFKQRCMPERTTQEENPPSLQSMDFNQNCLPQSYLTLCTCTQTKPKDFNKQQKSSPRPSIIISYNSTSNEERHPIIRFITKSSSLPRTSQPPSINSS